MNYVHRALINDARDAMSRSASQSSIDHKPLRGVLREEILTRILRPWMPPYIFLGKGTIVHTSNADRLLEGEDDIIICDEHVCPPLRVDSETRTGIYHYNGVLGRIEVKSRLEKCDIRQFVERSRTITRFKFDVRSDEIGPIEGAYNYLLAYDSKAKEKDEFLRFREVCQEKDIDPDCGFVSLYCVLGKGIYKFGHKNHRVWVKSGESSAEEQLARFVAIVAEMSVRAHIVRQGRSIEKSLETSLANFLPDPNWVRAIWQEH